MYAVSNRHPIRLYGFRFSRSRFSLFGLSRFSAHRFFNFRYPPP